MPNREPIETTNLDTIYGSETIPWSRPRDLLAVGALGGPGTPFFPRHRATRRPAACGGDWRRLVRRRPLLPVRAQDPQGAQRRDEPGLHHLREPAGHGPGRRGRGPTRRRHADARGGRRGLPRGRLAGAGGGRRVHGAVQRAQRRPAAVASFPAYGPHRVRRRDRRAVRRDALALLRAQARLAAVADPVTTTT